jgi:tetratricopeptide (TPR) repeat protein
VKRPVLSLAVVFLGCLAIPPILNADDAEDHFNRGFAWANKGEYEKAIAEYNQTMQLLDPSDSNDDAKIASVCFNRGKALNHKGEHDKAIADYNEALRLHPSNPVVYNGRGIAWSDKGEYEKAIADYNQALRLLDSKDSALIATVCCNRGVVWEKTGECDKAIADYNRALRLLDPNDTNSTSIVYYNRGNIWDQKDEFDKAIADYNQALAINPKFPHAYTNRGGVWRKKGEYEKAIADYNQCLAVDPKHASAYADLAFLRATCPDKKYRDGKKAVENAKKAYELDGGKKWESLDSLAAAYAESGDFEKAKEWEAKAIEMANTDKSAMDKKKAAARSRLELYKQGKPFREELKK